MHNPALILTVWGGGHKYDSHVLFILAKKEQYHPKWLSTEGIFGVLADTSNISAYNVAKMAGHVLLRIGLVLRLVALSSLACFSSVGAVFRLRSWRSAHQRVNGKSAVARYKHDLCDHSTLITSKG